MRFTAERQSVTDSPRQPAIFLSHGGGPCFWMEFPPPYGPGGFDRLRAYMAQLLTTLPSRPSAIVVITAHWEEPVVTVGCSPAPPMLFDYYGFPRHTYELSYPAPGSPPVAARIAGLFAEAGIEHAMNSVRGFDHGVFVPMLIVDPEARIPVVMMSLRQDLDPARHLAIGTAIARLRNENVLILGSGNTWHGAGGPIAVKGSAEFDNWIADSVTTKTPAARSALLQEWERAPYARHAQRREEHLLPLMVVVGAAEADPGRRTFLDAIGGIVTTCYAFG